MRAQDRIFGGYVFDLDSTAYLGDELLPGAARTRTELKRLSWTTGDASRRRDRHATDIRMAKAAGMAGALVLTGATGADEALASPDKPDYVIEDLNCCPRQGPGGAEKRGARMPKFIFMLTHEDKTVEDALEVYDEVRDAGLSYVGFKDVGLPFDRLKTLTREIHAGGHAVMLEVVSEREEDELRSARAALDLGVDYLLGGTHAEEVVRILEGSSIRYFPFPGRVVGHPSLLRGGIDEITGSARRLAQMDGVHGLDLLAYRYDGDVETLVRSVVGAVDVPVIAAGGVDGREKIRTLFEAGVWGFTVGSAIFEGRFGDSPAEGVKAVLSASSDSVTS